MKIQFGKHKGKEVESLSNSELKTLSVGAMEHFFELSKLIGAVNEEIAKRKGVPGSVKDARFKLESDFTRYRRKAP